MKKAPLSQPTESPSTNGMKTMTAIVQDEYGTAPRPGAAARRNRPASDVPPAETPRRPPGPAANGYGLDVVFGTGQVDHALASWLAGPGQACRRCRGAGHLGRRAPDATDPGCSGDTDEGADLLGKPGLPDTYSPVPDIAVGLATLGKRERAGPATGPAARAVRRGDSGFLGRACPCPGWLIGMAAKACG